MLNAGVVVTLVPAKSSQPGPARDALQVLQMRLTVDN